MSPAWLQSKTLSQKTKNQTNPKVFNSFFVCGNRGGTVTRLLPGISVHGTVPMSIFWVDESPETQI
jgi:hypothetical protein